MPGIRRVLVTGGAGFIGSAVVRHLLAAGLEVINVDKLTYSASLEALKSIGDMPGYQFHQIDICDHDQLAQLVFRVRPDAIMHLAAETHVDRSIDGPAAFVETNVVGTFQLLRVALDFWRSLDIAGQATFRFHHISTDEVFGALRANDPEFTETTPYAPSSPYSASKAAGDHFVRAWHVTYGLPVVLTNCSNNYGPFHFPEKLIPLTIINAIEGKPLPVYGEGANVRDWLFVDDHARALELVLRSGRIGESYNVGGRAELTNLQVVEQICDLVDNARPLAGGGSRRDLITFVADRPGHDFRYALDPSKIEQELGWTAQESFASGLQKTVTWFLENEWWWQPIRAQKYAGERLGNSR